MNLTGGVVVTIIGYGTFTASCPANYTLFHCGVGNVQQTYCDPFRYATPINSTTCQCRDNNWAGCLAYCRPVNPAGYQVPIIEIFLWKLFLKKQDHFYW